MIIRAVAQTTALSFCTFPLKKISAFSASVDAAFILLLLIVANGCAVYATVEKSHVRGNSAEVTLQLT
jgi:hypothetical protein